MSKRIENMKEIIQMQNENIERLNKEALELQEQLAGVMSAIEATRKRRNNYNEQLIKMLYEEKNKAQ